MIVELKKVKLTKTIINQLQYIGTLPSTDNYNVLGYVIIPKKVSKVIIYLGDGIYRWANNIKKVESIKKGFQFKDPESNGWIFPERTEVKVWTFEGRAVTFSPNFNEEENLKLLNKCQTYLDRIIKAGQIYY